MNNNEPESIDQIANEYRDGQSIYIVEGTLTKLYPPKNTNFGELQNGEIKDEHGDALKITFADCSQDNRTARNQFIRVESVEGQHGWTGVKVKDDEQYGRSIWVTQSASVTFPNGGNRRPQGNERPRESRREPQGGQGGQRGQRTQGPPPRQQGRQPDREQRGEQRGERGESRRPENQWESVDRIVDCYKFVRSLVNEKMGEDFREEQAATVFIEVAKAGVVALWSPNAKKPNRYPPAPSDPTKWADCVVPSGNYEGKTLADVTDEDLVKMFDYYDKKGANTPFAECVYKATEDRKLFKQEPSNTGTREEEPDAEDDIPF